MWDIDPEVWELDSHFPVEIRALFYKLIHDNILAQSSLKSQSLKSQSALSNTDSVHQPLGEDTCLLDFASKSLIWEVVYRKYKPMN